ncbi:MAG: amidophosphoribosyltransferase, partial [Clostridia bacterium]|nr:amidophosphoribosyltransferase [Clostridia bacterium]
MSVHEECGVFGIYSETRQNVAGIAYYGLYALQHRGQESCGITVNDDGVFASHKGIGLVGEVFSHSALASLPEARMAVGHTRYSTTGGGGIRNCQPIEVDHQKGKLALAHNGNLSNASALRSELELSGAIFHTSSDTEIIAYLVTKERLTSGCIEDAVSRAVARLEGAFSLVMMSARKLICVRDRHGFRPLCYGMRPDGAYVVASENCALNAVGAKFIRDVEPGEMIIFSPDGVTSRREHCGTAEAKHCVFEYIYFARPDSVLDGVAVHGARVKAGKILAQTYPVDADIVIGVPDSGLDAALGYAEASGIPYGIGLIKNKYVGRTFIDPDGRMDRVRLKLSAVGEEISEAPKSKKRLW